MFNHKHFNADHVCLTWQRQRKIAFEEYWNPDFVHDTGLPISSFWDEARLSLVRTVYGKHGMK